MKSWLIRSLVQAFASVSAFLHCQKYSSREQKQTRVELEFSPCATNIFDNVKTR